MKEDMNYSWLGVKGDIIIGGKTTGRTIPKACDSGLEARMSTYSGVIIGA